MLIERFFHSATKSFFLFGPRGTGKSTLVKTKYKTHVLIDLLDPGVYRQYFTYPERLKELIEANKETKTFIIDEVQKVPQLLSVVHQLIETNKELQFILTSSSARKLKQAGVNLLAGRAQLKFLHPFMATEIANSFNLEQNLKTGMLPLIYNSAEPRLDLKAYVALYMKEEVQMESLVRRTEQFAQFLEAISFSQGSIINYSNIARDCHVSSKTVENYINILEDLLLSFRINIFDKRAKRILSNHPKFYFFDCGVFQTIRPMGPLDSVDVVAGQALETLVAEHLRAWLDYSNQDGKLYFWRTKSGLEVDFIVYGEIGFYAMEVKNSNKIDHKDLTGLKEFKKDYPDSKCIFLYRGKEKRLINEILCLPVDNFLLALEPNTSKLQSILHSI